MPITFYFTVLTQNICIFFIGYVMCDYNWSNKLIYILLGTVLQSLPTQRGNNETATSYGATLCLKKQTLCPTETKHSSVTIKLVLSQLYCAITS